MAKYLQVKATKNGYRRAKIGFSNKQPTFIETEGLSEENEKALREDAQLVVVDADTAPEGALIVKVPSAKADAKAAPAAAKKGK